MILCKIIFREIYKISPNCPNRPQRPKRATEFSGEPGGERCISRFLRFRSPAPVFLDKVIRREFALSRQPVIENAPMKSLSAQYFISVNLYFISRFYPRLPDMLSERALTHRQNRLSFLRIFAYFYNRPKRKVPLFSVQFPLPGDRFRPYCPPTFRFFQISAGDSVRICPLFIPERRLFPAAYSRQKRPPEESFPLLKIFVINFV